jgi:hypothetical protein
MAMLMAVKLCEYTVQLSFYNQSNYQLKKKKEKRPFEGVVC